MRVTVLGKSPSWQDAGGACSGYLVEAGETTLLLDCGNGVLGKLRERIDYLDLDAIVISHIHADHVLDLVPLAYALTLSPRRMAGSDRSRLPLHLPPAGGDRLRELVRAWSNDDLLGAAYDIREYENGVAIELGQLAIVPTEVPHFTRTFAMTVSNAGRRFTFSADCGPNRALIEAARGNELLICEGTVRHPDPDGGHMTPAEAGKHAQAAGVGRLVVTHITDEIDLDEARKAAAAEFEGPVEIATEGAGYEV